LGRSATAKKNYKTRKTINFLKLYQYGVASVGILNSVQKYKMWTENDPI